MWTNENMVANKFTGNKNSWFQWILNFEAQGLGMTVT